MSSLETELAHIRIPLEDILIATNNFAEENLLKRGEKEEDVYKGLLLWSEVKIDVVIRKYSSTDLTFDFYHEIRKLSHLWRGNVVPFIGFCDEKDQRMIVMKDVLNGSLDKYLSDTTLTWYQRLHMCFDAALALNKIHDAIRSFKILLISEDSDVYRLGMILLGLLYGRKATTEGLNRYLAVMAKSQYHEDGKQLDYIIDPNLRTQMHRESLSLLSEIAYNCLNEQSDQQSPFMFKETVKRLKEAFHIQWKHEKHFKDIASLKIPLRRIVSATDNFAITHHIRSNMHESVYKAELRDSDMGNVLTKKKVIIKRTFSYQKPTEDFFDEIHMLTNFTHPKLVSLMGFCDDDSEMILVFQCAFRETLNGYLRSTSNQPNLTWEKRIRICLDIADGMMYLNNKKKGKPSKILSANVFLDEKWTAMIADFGLSEFSPYPASFGKSDQTVVMDDVYFLGVILFEVLTGRLAYDPFYISENVSGLASMARQHFNEGKIKNITDPRILEETQVFTRYTVTGPNQDSLDTFSKIAYQCLEETSSECPTLDDVSKSLIKALHFQVQNVQNVGPLKIALKDIQFATKDFDKSCRIGRGGYGEVYKCSLALKVKGKDKLTVAIKRILKKDDSLAKQGFLAEIDVLGRCEHPNIISLLGFCDEGNEMLLVYEYAPNKSLDEYLNSRDKIINFTWAQRLKMCIDIAYGLRYLHTTTWDKKEIIHRDIKSDNILMGENWEAKIGDFGLSKVHHENQQASTFNTNHIAGTDVYLDPEYAMTGKLKKSSDIYSFGVVLFEIFSGKVAYDQNYMRENGNGIAPIAQKHFENKTLEEILDPKIRDEAHEHISALKVGPYQESLNAFAEIAYRCLAKTQAKRPTIEEVIRELEKALMFQENRKDVFRFSLEDIRLGVGYFSDNNCITRGNKVLYKGEVQYINGQKKVVVKRFNKTAKEHDFVREFEVLFKHKQENIIGLVGYCKEQDEKIIVYEHAFNGCLSSHLNVSSLSWNTRLKICIDIANGLKFLHGCDVRQDVVIHRDIKSSNILLTKDWKAKICGLEVSVTHPANQEREHVMDDVVGSPGYCDVKTKILTEESDIYSFGVVLFEILCGRLAYLEEITDHHRFLDELVKLHFQEAQVNDIVFKDIKEQIVPESLVAFQSIAFQCLHEEKEKRPKAGEVLLRLQYAWEIQEDYEISEAKLPRNYIEILQFSKSPEIYSTMPKKDIKNILSKGIFLKNDNLWFSLSNNGEINEMIAARMFSFKNRWSHKWRSLQESRFRKVAKMLDITNLYIQIKIKTQLLASDLNYSVRLVFKFCGPRTSHAKRMYVNLKYKIGSENLHAYFATWREDDWMMIELCRFSNHKKDTNFEILLDGFSGCYFNSPAIYIEGIEFQSIGNVKEEKTENEGIPQVLKSSSKIKIKKDQMLWYQPSKTKIKKDQMLWYPLSKMKRKVHQMEYAKGVVYDFSSVTF